MFKTTRALVLRETKYKEADKMLTLLTEDEGKQSAAAKGVLGRSGKLSAACQFLTFSEFTLYEGRGRLYIREARSLEQFLGLREDISLLALGSYFAELLETVSDEESPNARVLSLGLNSLFALSRRLYGQEHIKSVFELRLMCLSGFEPALDCCAVCGEPEPEQPYFSTQGGTLICRNCRRAEYGGAVELGEASLAAMRHVVASDPKRIFSFTLDGDGERQLADAAETYVKTQLERGFSSLDYWKNVKDI